MTLLSKQHIVITGGTGLIGTALARSLAADGFAVTVTGLGPAQPTQGKIAYAQWNGRSVEQLLPLIDGAYAIVHLAGEPITGRWTAAKKDAILRSRVESGTALSAAVRKVRKKPKVLIQASASGYYGASDAAVDERSPVGKSFLASVCAHWEASTESLERIGVRRCVIRTTPVLARGGYLAARAQPFRWFFGGTLGNGTQWVSAIHLVDEVAAIKFLLATKTCAGVYNLSAPNPCLEHTMANAIGGAVRRPSWLRTPIWLLRLRYGELADEMAASARVVPTRLLNAGFTFQHPDLPEAVANALK